jgi:hypothetical protein
MFLPKWFQYFLATCCIVGSIMLFFGYNNSGTVKLREIDASIGMLTRHKKSKILEKVEFLYKPIKTEAFVITLAADIPRVIEYAIKVAINFIISKIINTLVNKVLSFFNNIIEEITSWIDTVTGLKDNTSAWQASIAMKAYQVTECLNKGTSEILDELVVKHLKSAKNSVAKDIYGYVALKDKLGSAIGGPQCTQYIGDASKGYQTMKNSLASLRNNAMTAKSQLSQANTLQDETNSVDSNNKTENGDISTPEIPGEETTKRTVNIGKQKIQTTQTIEQVESDANQFAVIFAETSCTVDQKSKAQVNSNGLISPDEFNFQAAGNCQKELVKSDVLATLNRTFDSDDKVYNSVDAQVKNQAPADCRGFGYTDFKNDPSAGEIDRNFDLKQGVVDVVYSSIKSINLFQSKTFNGEQCKNLDRTPTVQAQVKASTSSNSSSAETTNIGAIVDQIKNVLQNLKSQVIEKIFSYFEKQIAKFVSGIGNSYISSAITKISGEVTSSARTALTNISLQSARVDSTTGANDIDSTESTG